MSKLVSIIEGQSSKQFNNAEYLRTSLQGGGYCDWVPEDERNLKTKSVTKNGTYQASADSAFGFSEFTVNVPKKDSVTGKKPNGNSATVSKDDNGYLKEDGVPDYIRITTNPNKMSYDNGESISMTGAVITGYNADGTVWGNVPLSEVTTEPTKATRSSDTDIWQSGDGINAKLITYVPVTYQYVDYPEVHGEGYAAIGSTGIRNIDGVDCTVALGSPYGAATLFVTIYNGGLYAMLLSGNTTFDQYLYNDGTQEVGYGKYIGWVVGGGAAYHTTYNEWTSGPWEAFFYNTFPRSTRKPTGGASDMHKVPESQTVTVKWNRPGDSKELTTSFSISVT